MSQPRAGLSHSVQVRLVRHAKGLGVDPNLVLSRFAVERFLYRLSCSTHADRFVLKGALMLVVWLGEMIRPTRDADLLGFGDLSDDSLTRTFAEVCRIEVEPDGLVFDPSSIRIADIRIEDPYGGKRVLLKARLGPARLRVQVDVGIGDAVFPEPEWLDYPSLLGLPRPRLRAYRPETAIAEKTHAMVVLGIRNSRMRDYFDIDALATREVFDGARLVQAVRVTFNRRRTPLPTIIPIGLTAEFAADEEKSAQWSGFVRRAGLRVVPETLGTVIDRLAQFLGPVLDAASRGAELQSTWSPGGPWRPGQTSAGKTPGAA